MNRDQIPQQDRKYFLTVLHTLSLLSFTDPPYCSCKACREDLGPCGLESALSETFRAQPNNSNYASWLYSLSFFSSLFSTSLQLIFFWSHAFSLKHALTALIFTTPLRFCCTSWAFSVLPFFLLYLSLSLCLSAACSLALSEVPLRQANFAGLPKGAQGRGNFLQHMLVRCGAEQKVSKDSAEREGGGSEETEGECECKVDNIKFK